MAQVDEVGPPPRGVPGWLAWPVAAVAYAGFLVAATYPVAARVGQEIPGGRTDPAAHLWTLRWYERCLDEGRAPFFCPELNYPVGVALGQEPPLQIQALAFLGLRAVSADPIVRYDLIWLLAFLTTGLGTMLLCRSVCRDWLSAWLGGLLAMLSGPMLLHGHGHIELISLGGFPLFLWSWLRWLERPGLVRLLGAVTCYLVMSMCAPYFGVMAVYPAILAFGFAAARQGRANVRGWLRGRIPGLAIFGTLSLAGMAVLFSSQLWAMTHGVPMVRSADQFASYGVRWWGYFVPIPYLRLGPWLGQRLYADPQVGFLMVEIGSYLGVVCLALLAAALGSRNARLPGRGLWWAMLAMLVVLSFGSTLDLGFAKLPMPSGWLRELFPPMKSTRVPARFNLFAVVVAAVLASGALASMLDRLRWRWARPVVVGTLAVVTLVDLGYTPFPRSTMPEAPSAYARVLAMDPRATFLEVPQHDTFGGLEALELSALAAYWQGDHRGRTLAGYTAVANPAFENGMGHTSPFLDRLMRQPGYAESGEIGALDLGRGLRLEDSAWLYLDHYGLRYLVLHKWFAERFPHYKAPLEHLARRLEPYKVIEDAEVAIYDGARLPRPVRPVLAPTSGWTDRRFVFDRIAAGVASHGRLELYCPEEGEDLTIALEATSRRRPRRVRLVAAAGTRVLGEWMVAAGRFETLVTPAFQLPAGRHELIVEVADLDDRDLERPDPERPPLRVSVLTLVPAAERHANASTTEGAPR